MIDEAARRIARQCREIIQDVLYAWEIADAEQEFYAVILTELRALQTAARCRANGAVDGSGAAGRDVKR